MRLAAYQPDIPQNLGALLRISACFATPLEVIEPCGFPLTDKALKRAAMDYERAADVIRRPTFRDFLAASERTEGRLVLVETGAETPLHAFRFAPGDTLALGRESAGSSPELWAAAQARVFIPMAPGARSLNVAVAGAVALVEALRQTGFFERV